MLRRAHYNAFCGNLAALTHYLKSLGLLSSSGTEKSLHTSCGQADSLGSYLARADPRHVLEIRRKAGRVLPRNGQGGLNEGTGSETQRVKARNDGGGREMLLQHWIIKSDTGNFL